MTWRTFRDEAEKLSAEEAKKLYQKLISRKNEKEATIHQKAAAIFLEREVILTQGYENELLIPHQGVPRAVLIGTWNEVNKAGLYVRADCYNELALQQIDEAGGFTNWCYYHRPDVEETGFFVTQHQISPSELESAVDTIKRFNQTLNGYEQITKARQ